MARLCRIHIAGAGRESARFNPLTVDLRNPQTGSAQDSVIWLRNGGGKTTLISLFYSLLVPNSSHFLGKMNGKGASIEDFLRPDQLAIIVTEWDFLVPGLAKRVVGQALLLKERKFTRKYFSFSAVTDFDFDKLPVYGISQAAKSLDKFDEALREAQRAFPSMDLVIEETQWKWQEHLLNLGLDPSLFRAHLIMNSQEGGAAEMFKIKSPGDFVARFLELVYDEQSTEEIEKTLKLFREKLGLNPSYRAAIEFGDTLLKTLRPFSHDATRMKRLSEEKETIHQELRQVGNSMRAHTVTLKEEITSLNAQIEECDEAAGRIEKERSRKDRFSRGYEKKAKRLLVLETEKIRNEKIAVSNRTERALSILISGKAYQKKRISDAELQASLEALEAKRTAHRPELDRVQLLGAELRKSWEDRIQNLEADYELTEENGAKCAKALTDLYIKRTKLSVEQRSASSARDGAQVAIRRYEEARRILKDQGAILDGETGADARQRWQFESGRLEADIQRLTGAMSLLKESIAGASATAKSNEGKVVALRERIAGIDAVLAAEERKRIDLEKLELLIQIADSKSPDLRNPYILDVLDSKAEDIQAELIRFGVEDAEDKRDDLSLEREGLFATPKDVEEVLHQLKRHGITSALPVYRWLAEHVTSHEATQMLRQHPTIYSGILIQSYSDFEKAADLANAQIRLPVAVLPPSSLPGTSEQKVIGHTVVPSDAGLFSKLEAANARSALAMRRNQRSALQEQTGQLLRTVQNISSRLRAYIEEFPLLRLKELSDSRASQSEELFALDAEQKRLEDSIAQFKIDFDNAHEEQNQASRSLTVAHRKEAQLASFVTEHEEHIGGNRLELERQQQLLSSATTALLALEGEEAQLKATQAEIAGQEKRLYAACLNAKDIRDKLPKEYCASALHTEPVRSPEELSPAFFHAIEMYEGKIQKGEIEGKIVVQRKQVAEAALEFDKARGSLPLNEIVLAANEAEIGVAISRAQTEHNDAKDAAAVANSDHIKAKHNSPGELDFKEGEELDRDRVNQPVTSEEANKLVQEYRSAAASLKDQIEHAREQAKTATNRKHILATALSQYNTWSGQLPKEDPGIGHPAFAGSPEPDERLITALLDKSKNNGEQLARTERSLTEKYDKQIHPHISDPSYDRHRIPFRARLKLLHREDFVQKADEQIESIETQIRTCQNELDSEEQERRTILEKLDAIGRRTVNILGQAEVVSAMPEAIKPWAGQPFLRINVPRKNDPVERQVLLRQATDRWFEEETIPSGHKLAYEVLIALCGSKGLNVRILKPEYHLSPTGRDIMEMVKFSDGEKLTAAILIYCVLVRIRARQKIRSDHLLKDSGMLLLDNPFGKATLADFVDLQIRMARLMGVQLIYATGINDFSALKHFPHYVRLRNSSRGKSSNDYHVENDLRPFDEDSHVSGIMLGRTEKSVE